MSHVFFATELEGVATWWRIDRRDGVTLGFTSHDRDLTFDGVTHRAAPGILPSAIRKTATLDGDSAELTGPLAHDSISAADLAAGRFDGARVSIGAVDWETLERAQLFAGSIGTVQGDDDSFTADLLSAKQQLQVDDVPRTSPTCRATFCGPGCTLSAARFSREARVASVDREANAVAFDGVTPSDYAFGQVRWIEGPHVGIAMDVVAVETGALVLDTPLDGDVAPGQRVRLREGCDHTIGTCQARFANAANFQGEPFLPGNDLLARYPVQR
ncbi:DUF2163 domain-containing protein [Erythrobacter litoralis]|uniref:Bacteriophage phiJL001 Gp84 C-terminal domain-containing protein n=1 Tax=Erythrobacter litoralis (strain HTCC2594) TaxID=314225 RepID=Q2N605_ERYLH|nr:DUF2163 domain-containing protein [Erythrobacter litoralis]ABC64886.1 hypothetical protein ELI_13970 [Erythrobacter litoralis HTCC2594]